MPLLFVSMFKPNSRLLNYIKRAYPSYRYTPDQWMDTNTGKVGMNFGSYFNINRVQINPDLPYSNDGYSRVSRGTRIAKARFGLLYYDVVAPVDGKVLTNVCIDSELKKNSEPWIFSIEPKNPKDIENLMTYNEYNAYVEYGYKITAIWFMGLVGLLFAKKN